MDLVIRLRDEKGLTLSFYGFIKFYRFIVNFMFNLLSIPSTRCTPFTGHKE